MTAPVETLSPSAQRLLRSLRAAPPRGLERLALTTSPTIDHRPPMHDIDDAIAELQAAGYSIRATSRRRYRRWTGGVTYRLLAEPPSPPALFDKDVGRALPTSAIAGDVDLPIREPRR